MPQGIWPVISGTPAIWGAALFLVAAVAAGLLIRVRVPRADRLLLPVAIALSGVGTAEVGRLQPDLFVRQIGWLVIGLLAFSVLSGSNVWRRLAHYKYLIGIAGVLLLASTLVVGVEVGGARSWIALGPFSFQPSEIVKILLAAFLAAYLVDTKELLAIPTRRVGRWPVPDPRAAGPLVIMWFLFLVMLVGQRDLGGALLFFGVFLSMLYVATGRMEYPLLGFFLILIGGTFAYLFYTHVQVRIHTWIDPWADFDGRGYQLGQSLFSLAAGGIVGKGLGMGEPWHIPAAHTDFIFPSLAEELGLAGALAILGLYIVLIGRGLRIALRATGEFAQLFATGLTSVLAIQTLLIIGGVTRLIPVTGVTLPFVSYGGSSMITSFAVIGLLEAVSAEREPDSALPHGREVHPA